MFIKAAHAFLKSGGLKFQEHNGRQPSPTPADAEARD